MKKCNMFFNIEKEEKWLNEQLQAGYRCTNISWLGVYTFKETHKNYVMRLDYQGYLSKKKHQEYKTIYEDFGWDYVEGYSFGGIQYWQKESDEQEDIFSDRESKGNYYKRLMGYSLGFALMSLFFTTMILTDMGFSGLYHEGLWSMNGSLFWRAFVFETPFVLLKLAPVIFAILFGCSFYKSYRNYTMV